MFARLLCRSDIGSDVGFEATGIVDCKLPTVGIWARRTDEVTSRLCPLNTTCLSLLSVITVCLSVCHHSLPTVFNLSHQESEMPVNDFSRGVVFYLDSSSRRIVGVLSWNIFGKMDLAKQVCVVYVRLFYWSYLRSNS